MTTKARGIAMMAALLTLLAVAAGYSYLAWTPILNDFGGDSAVYLHMAAYYSPFMPADGVAAYFARQSQYPPVYPLLLAFTGGAGNLLVAHQATAACLVAAIAAFFFWLRREGISTGLAVAYALGVALLPGVSIQAMYLLSEAPFLFFCALSLCAMAGMSREQTWGWVLTGSLAAAGAYLTRTVGIAVVLVWLGLLLLHRPGRWRIAAAACLLPILIWTALAPREGAGYFAIFQAKLAGGVGGYLEGLLRQCTSILGAWPVNLSGSRGHGVGSSILGLAAAYAWFRRLLAGKPDALLVGVYLGIIMLWPFPAESTRLLMPMVPILLGELMLHAKEARFVPPKLARFYPPSVLVILAVTVLPQQAIVLQRFGEPLAPELADYRRTFYWFDAQSQGERVAQLTGRQRIDQSLQELGALVPAGECIYSIKPALVGHYAQRISVATPLDKAAPAGIKCRYVHMLPLATPTYSSSLYPFNEWRDRLEVVKTFTLVPNDDSSPLIGVLARIKPD